MTKQEILNLLNGSEMGVEHTEEESMANIVESMRKNPTMWKKLISSFGNETKPLRVGIRTTWGEVILIMSDDLIEIWNEVKAA
jgi:hypothetical protein